jgi:ribosomal subunit interface protein
MKINTKGSSITLTPDVTAYLDKKLDAVRKLVTEEDAVCSIELSRSTRHNRGDVFGAEITIEIPGREGLFRAEAQGETIESAIDGAQEEILSELRRQKRKYLHLLRRGGQKLKDMVRGFKRG